LALREWGSSASGFASSPRRSGPGSLARRALPGLFVCAALLLPAGRPCARPAKPRHPAAAVQAAGPEQPPEDTTPPGGGGTDTGAAGGPEEEVFPDTTLFVPPLGPKPAPGDTAGAAADTSRVRSGAAGAGVDTTGAAIDTTGIGSGAGADGVDTAGVARPAVGLPQSGALPPGTGPTPPGPPAETKTSARKGVFGLHPAVIILGLVVAHVFLVKLITK
jgi:hypothetical protein